MARKRVIEPPSIKSWEDANEALRQIAEATIALADIEGEMNKQILGAKKAAEEQSKPFKDRVAKLERELKDFVTENRSDMGKAKSKTLTFGEVSFRLSTSISLPRAKEKLEEAERRLRLRAQPRPARTDQERGIKEGAGLHAGRHTHDDAKIPGHLRRPAVEVQQQGSL